MFSARLETKPYISTYYITENVEVLVERQVTYFDKQEYTCNYLLMKNHAFL